MLLVQYRYVAMPVRTAAIREYSYSYEYRNVLKQYDAPRDAPRLLPHQTYSSALYCLLPTARA